MSARYVSIDYIEHIIYMNGAITHAMEITFAWYTHDGAFKFSRCSINST